MSILIVEDDEGVQESLATLLRMEGYDVETVSDGSAALRRLSDEPPPNLILLDLIMPHMDGVEFRSRQLADSRIANIPVIIVSACAEARGTAERLGAVDFLLKPMSFEALLLAVQNTAITVVTTQGIPGSPKSLREAWRALHHHD
ncbi:MAG: two-component response regulator [Myxococcales bacterium]|nr:two-component response regulator [Myxococcales bacterium]